MKRELTILFNPIDGFGHVNACIGIGERLKEKGHRIVFIANESWTGKLEKYGFEEVIKKDPNKNPGQHLINFINKDNFMHKSSIDKVKALRDSRYIDGVVKRVIDFEPQMKSIIDKYNPDISVIDHVVLSPSLVYSGKPWVRLLSFNPLFAVDDERTPPSMSGYPLDGNPNEWKEFRDILHEVFDNSRDILNEWLKKSGFPVVKGHRIIPESQFLNLYAYPEDLDYTDIRPMPPKWFRVESFHRKTDDKFEIPETLEKRTGKLIYLSMGTIGSADIELMKRLIEILSRSPHKFIVSKGPFEDKFELADNMWGQKSLPQTNVIPLVDLVITHAGHNTVNEALFFGKPMIAMPLFIDQFEDAQRIDEKGFGIRLDPYKCTADELIAAIDQLLSDEKLKLKLNCLASKMQTSKSMEKVVELIENLVDSEPEELKVFGGIIESL